MKLLRTGERDRARVINRLLENSLPSNTSTFLRHNKQTHTLTGRAKDQKYGSFPLELINARLTESIENSERQKREERGAEGGDFTLWIALAVIVRFWVIGSKKCRCTITGGEKNEHEILTKRKKWIERRKESIVCGKFPIPTFDICSIHSFIRSAAQRSANISSLFIIPLCP